MSRLTIGTLTALCLVLSYGCSSSSSSDTGATDVPTDTSTGKDEGNGKDTQIGNACHACVLAGKGMALRFVQMDVKEPSEPAGLPTFLNNIWGPDLDAYRLNVILRLDEVTDNGDGTLDVKVTAGAGWHDLTIEQVTPIVHADVPTEFQFVEGFTTTFDATIDENCKFQTDKDANLWFHPGPLDHAFICSGGDDTIGLPKDTIPIANLDASGYFDDQCTEIVGGKMTGCIAADAACQICSFILAPNYENWSLEVDPTFTSENCQVDYCNHYCGKGDSGMPLWANFGRFVEDIGVPKTCDVNGPDSGYGLAGDWEANLIQMKAD